jgi:glycolate oxidase iron-sulfur subunit
LYVDLPCHLIHGQRVAGIPETILNATGYRWELAPMATECCGSGGTYNLQKPENSRQILARKAAFLETAEGEPVILGTSNHVCMMQWYSARTLGIVSRPFEVRHIIQLLDEIV